MVRKLILFMSLMLMLLPTIKANENDGFRLWGLVEQSIDAESSIQGRLGYQIDSFEPFIGISWLPKQDTETGKLNPPNLISLGGMLHLPDIVDVNAPLPWLPQVLTSFLSDDFESRPYLGWHGSWAIVDDDAGGFHGGILGLKNKLVPEDEAEYIVELQYNKYFADLAELKDDDEFVLYFGIRVPF